jgi:glycine hydroxymethyltransferase
MFVVDLRSHGITGKDAALALEQAHIIVSKSCIPHDPEKPWITSGIRIGTPALATRNVTIPDAQLIASLIDDVIKNHADRAFIEKIRKQILQLCNKYPIF